MIIDIITLFPDMFTNILADSILKRAIGLGSLTVNFINPRDYTKDKHNRVDDTPYGGGSGLVMMAEPIYDALMANPSPKKILMCPQGLTYTQELAYELAKEEHITLFCGHYEGVDERIRSYFDLEISIGDYVLTGGEIPAMVIVDSVARLLDGVINNNSHQDDSFSIGLLEYPQYTKPQTFQNMSVPEVLISGHHANIERYRLKESIRKTYRQRKDLLAKKELSELEKQLLEEVIKDEN